MRAWPPKIGYVLQSSPDRKEALDHDHGIWGNCSELIAKVPAAHRRKPMLCFIGLRAASFRMSRARKPADREA
jgi:hypothetical protein